MSSWTDAVAGAESVADKGRLKLEVDLQSVCVKELGITFDGYNADCPFCDDTTGHFSVYGEGLTKVGCWKCSWNGDVFDVVQVSRDCDFKEALRVVQDYHTQGLTIDLEANPSPGVHVSPRNWQVVIDAARENADLNDKPIAEFLTKKNLQIPVRWLRDEFLIGTRGGTNTIVIPHLDREGTPLGYKERRWDTVPISAKGARLTLDLYGAWRDQKRHAAVICEGESDTWTVAYMFRNELDVFGLPVGAGSPPREHLVELLKGRRVVIAFDGDSAGRQGADRWNTALPGSVVLRFSDGQDCSSTEPKVLRHMVREALL